MALGLAAGLGLGLVAAATKDSHPLLLRAATAVRPMGTLFLNLLEMVVIPLVAAALFSAVASLGNVRQVGRLGGRTLAFFFGITFAAIIIGMVVASLLLPLAPISPENQATLRAAAQSDSTTVQRSVEQIPSGARFLVELVPSNPVKAAVDGNLLPLIVFVTIFGIAAAALTPEKRAPLTEVADVVTQALVRVVEWVLLLAPIGIFALVAPVVAQLGWAVVKAMGMFIFAVIVGVVVFIVAVLLPAVKLIARLPARRFLQASLPSMAMAFSTTLSLATLPTMLEAGRDMKISPPVANFVLPLGASVGRAGSALYQAVAVLFVAQLYGVPLGFTQIVQAGLAVFLASLTVASVPSASVVSLTPAFVQTGLPFSGLTLLIGLDRIPDMFRTMTNVTGDLTSAVVVASIEGEKLE
ncbi:MAG TPA: dicarboxylate/amino acid:cation symporter [Gemmatimonadales bacterium]